MGLLSLVFQPLQELSELYGQVQSAGAAMGKISIVLDTEIEIASQPGAIVAPQLEGTLDVDHVTFAYGKKPVLCDVDLHVPAGGCIALVGESGGGKSTLAKLIGRFYDPDEGAIRVDGHDLRDLDLLGLPPAARRRAAGPVPVRRHDRRQRALRAAPTRPTTRCATSPRPSASTASQRASRAGSSTTCARAAPASRRASGS